MSDETKAQETTEETPGRTFTEEEFQHKLDAAIKERLSRERKKYADYDDLKAKAAKFDEFEESQKSDLQKAQEQIEKLQAQITAREEAEKKEALVSRIADEYNIPSDYHCFLTAEDEDELKAQAELLGTKFAEVSANDGRKPADVKAPKDEMDDFFDQLSEIATTF